jgi:branched-chain amino acid transport system permease protein
MMHAPLLRARVLHRLTIPYILLFAAALIAAVGVVLLIELTYQLMAKAGDGSGMRMFGISFDAATAWPWLAAVGLVAGGAILTRAAWPIAAQALSDGMAAARAGGRP